MEEKAMVSDALFSINACLASFGSMIPQTENLELRKSLQQMRNSTEQSQLELYNLARSKKYYVPAKHAAENEVVEMKTTLENMKYEKCRTTL